MRDHAIVVLGILTALAAVGEASAQANAVDRPFLHPIFSGHMVLQRDRIIPVWGWAASGSKVRLSISGQLVEVTAGADGRWVARIGPLGAGGPYDLEVTGPEGRTLEDVLMGDVWLCSGQSNMEFPVKKAANGAAEISQADFSRTAPVYGEARTFVHPAVPASGNRRLASGVARDSGGFFCRLLFLRPRTSSNPGCAHRAGPRVLGGTLAEAWMSPAAIAGFDNLADELAEVRELANEPDKVMGRWRTNMKAWWVVNDPGSATGARWQDRGLRDQAWGSIQAPGKWEDLGHPDFDGIAWYRESFELPEGPGDSTWRLSLGAVDDRGTAWVNGVLVGESHRYDADGSYDIPPGVLRPGRNIIALRVLDTGGSGGLRGEPDDLKLTSDDGAIIPLAGRWRFRTARALAGIPRPPKALFNNRNAATVLYNGMISPLVPFAFKGVAWYHGESNSRQPALYYDLLPALIQDWRTRFGQKLPFQIVQIANFLEQKPLPDDSPWAEIREAQRLTAEADPLVGLAVTIDIGEAGDVHPKNKQDVRHRLALSALKVAYGRELIHEGPAPRGIVRTGGHIIVRYENTGEGLSAGDGSEVDGFALCNDQSQCVWAAARIMGDDVEVTIPDHFQPRAIRYGWAINPKVNLYNSEALPTVPFQARLEHVATKVPNRGQRGGG